MQSHRALHTEDVLHAIFSFVSPNVLSDRQRTLVRAALVCSSFCAPALDALWRELHNLAPVTALLPPALRNVLCQLSDDAPGHHTLSLSSIDLTRFRHYTVRVRSLTVTCPDEAFSSQDPIAILSRLSRLESPTFPALSALRWSQPIAHGTHLLQYLTPDLRHLEVTVGELESPAARFPAFQCLLHALVDRSPRLRYLKLTGGWRRESLALGELRYLRTVDVNSCNAAISMLSCAGQESLTRLSAVVPAATEDDATSGFAELQALELKGYCVDVAAFLAKVTSRSMSMFVLRNQHLLYAQRCGDLANIFSALGSQFSASLRVVDVRCPLVVPSDDFAVSFADFIRPLLNIPHLEELRISTTSPTQPSTTFDISDEDISAMAKAWPILGSLKLEVMANRVPSIAALPSLAERCPALHTLHLPYLDLDDLAAPSSEHPKTPPQMRHGLRILRLNSLWRTSAPAGIANALPLIQFLARLFVNCEITAEGTEWGTFVMRTQDYRRLRDSADSMR